MWYIIIALIITVIVFITKNIGYYKQQQENERKIKDYQVQINNLAAERDKYSSLYRVQEKEIENLLKFQGRNYPYLAKLLAEYETFIYKRSEDFLAKRINPPKIEPLRINELRKLTETYITHAKISIIHLEYLKYKYPNLKDSLELEFNNIDTHNARDYPVYLSSEIKQKINEEVEKKVAVVREEYKKDLTLCRAEPQRLSENYIKLLAKKDAELEILLSSQKKSIPHLAGMMGDFLTLEYKRAEEMLKLKSRPAYSEAKRIKELCKQTKEVIKENKILKYQKDYLASLFPIIEDILEVDYEEIDKDVDIGDFDPVRRYISKEEWATLSESDRNQLALDNYIAMRKKSNWQLGRDYEMFIGYEYEKQGYDVDYFGSYMGVSDYGRDLIVKKDGIVLIVQCKYWSKNKTIHEKHINQLFGTMVSYSIENSIILSSVKGVFATSTKLSDNAKMFAKRLNIEIIENKALGDFPRIKCNIGKDESGKETKDLSPSY